MAKNVHLTFKGYHGHANYRNIIGLITSRIMERLKLYEEIASGESSLVTRAGTAHMDNVLSVVTGESNLSVVGPTTASMGYHGTGLFKEPHPELRVIGHIPHDDVLVLAVDREKIDIDSFDDIAERKVSMGLSTQYNDGWDTLGYTIEEVFKAHGFSSEDLEKWGGKLIRRGGPTLCLQEAIAGNADAIFHEAVMIPPWKELTEKRNMKFIPMNEDAIAHVVKTLGVRRKVMRKGRLRGVDQDIPALNWGDWIILTTDKLADDIAYLIAQILVEDSKKLDSYYTHLPHELSALDYPVTPEKVLAFRDWDIPVHPGAQQYYCEKGYLT